MEKNDDTVKLALARYDIMKDIDGNRNMVEYQVRSKAQELRPLLFKDRQEIGKGEEPKLMAIPLDAYNKIFDFVTLLAKDQWYGFGSWQDQYLWKIEEMKKLLQKLS